MLRCCPLTMKISLCLVRCGTLRYVKYVRFLLKEYFPAYKQLTAKHAAAILAEDEITVAAAEDEISALNQKFFAF